LKIARTLAEAFVVFFFAFLPGRVAGFSLDGAANYAVMYEGAGNHNFTVNSSSHLDPVIQGNVGIGSLSNGTPTVHLNNGVTVQGNIDFAGTVSTANSGSGHATGTTLGGVSSVNSALIYLNNLSVTLGGLSGTALTINPSSGQTINATDGTLHGSDYVFTVNSMSFGDHDMLTINGSASQYVVLNFGGGVNTHFSGEISLSGGITADHVLFNMYSGANLMAGPSLQTAANNNIQYVTYLDPNGTININSVTVYGHLYGGDSTDMQITSNAGVVLVNTVPEPSTAALVGIACVFGLGIWSRRRH
jgi:hypothetical protein